LFSQLSVLFLFIITLLPFYRWIKAFHWQYSTHSCSEVRRSNEMPQNRAGFSQNQRLHFTFSCLLWLFVWPLIVLCKQTLVKWQR